MTRYHQKQRQSAHGLYSQILFRRDFGHAESSVLAKRDSVSMKMGNECRRIEHLSPVDFD